MFINNKEPNSTKMFSFILNRLISVTMFSIKHKQTIELLHIKILTYSINYIRIVGNH